jgi:hypothetical protein
MNIVNHAVISKPAYHEEQIILKSESATHHQLNDAQIQSSGGASSKFNNVVVNVPAPPSPKIVETKKVFVAPKSTIELAYKTPAPLPMKTDVSAGYKMPEPVVVRKTDMSAGFIDDREPETIIQVVKEIEVQRVEVPVEVVKIQKVEVPVPYEVEKIVEVAPPTPKRGLVSTGMHIAKEVIPPPQPAPVQIIQPQPVQVPVVHQVPIVQQAPAPIIHVEQPRQIVQEVTKEVHHHHDY